MTGDTIERRAFRNSKVGGLSFVFNLGLTLLLVPILLQQWGSERYGVWLALMAGFSLLQTLDLGHQGFVGNQLNMQYHVDMAEFRETLGSSILIAYALGLLELATGVVVIAVGALPRVLNLSPEVVANQGLSAGILIMMAVWMLFASAGGVVVRIMIPAGKYYECQWTGIVAKATQFAAIAVVALTGGSILEACVSYAVIQAATSLGTLWYVRRLLPELYPWFQDADWRVGLRGLRRSLGLTLAAMIQQVSTSGIVILVSTLFAAAAVPAFTTLRTVTNTAASVTTILISAVLPDIVRFHVTRQPDRLADALDGHWILSGATVNVGILLLLPMVEPLYMAWTRGRLHFDPVLLVLLLVATSLVNFGSGLTAYLAGINDVRAQLMVMSARVVVLFGLTAALGRSLGMVAVGVASVGAEIVGSVLLPLILARGRLFQARGSGSLEHWKLAIVPPLALLLVAVPIATQGFSPAWISLILAPVLATTYYLHWKALGVEVRRRIVSLVLSQVRGTRA